MPDGAERLGAMGNHVPVSFKTFLRPRNFGQGRPPMNYSYNYWKAFDRWLNEKGSSWSIFAPVENHLCALRPKGRNLSISCGGSWYLSENRAKIGLMVMVKLQGSITSVYDNRWIPNRERIEEQMESEMSWSVFRPDLRWVTVRKRGLDFRKKEEQPEHFAWYEETVTHLKQTLFGEMPLESFIRYGDQEMSQEVF